MRGCPNRCSWCHNPSLLSGERLVPLEVLQCEIRTCTIAVSGIVFSGGEPTYQPKALLELLRYSKKLGLYTAIHTSGIFPEVLAQALDEHTVDSIALDIKATWEHYPSVLGNSFTDAVKASLLLCRTAFFSGVLHDFSVIHTVFPDTHHWAPEVAKYAPEVPLVLQQGNDPRGNPTISPRVLRSLASSCGEFRGDIRVRTRELGEERVAARK